MKAIKSLVFLMCALVALTFTVNSLYDFVINY